MHEHAVSHGAAAWRPSVRGRSVGALLLLSASLLGCPEELPPRTPDECKVTTDPEACRRQFGGD